MAAPLSSLALEPGSDSWLDALCEHGWAVLDHWFTPELIAALAQDAAAIRAAGGFQAAAVGAPGARQLRPEIRGDFTYWLDGATAAQQQFLAAAGALGDVLRSELRIALERFESHYACYPPGSRFQRHFDNARGRSERQITLVTYLNDGWALDDGGELAIYESGGTGAAACIAPAAPRAVLFLCDRIDHEVLPTARERWSISGWYQSRPLRPIGV